MPRGVYKRIIPPWNKGIPRSQKVKDAISRGNKGLLVGSKNPNWKGGIITDGKGYISIYSPNHPLCNRHGQVRRSHLVMEKMIGRYLKRGEEVHHKGVHFSINSFDNRQDDSPENLHLFSSCSSHSKFHNKQRIRNELGQFIS